MAICKYCGQPDLPSRTSHRKVVKFGPHAGRKFYDCTMVASPNSRKAPAKCRPTLYKDS